MAFPDPKLKMLYFLKIFFLFIVKSIAFTTYFMSIKSLFGEYSFQPENIDPNGYGPA